MAAGVFISFRPQDAAWAERIRNRWQVQVLLGRPNDLGPDIGHGVDFANALKTHAGQVKAVVLIIARHWLKGMRNDPNDPVRIEIEAAFNRKIRVIPVLVDGASMPAASALPESLRVLARLQAIKLSSGRFDLDIWPLEETLYEGAATRHRELGQGLQILRWQQRNLDEGHFLTGNGVHGEYHIAGDDILTAYGVHNVAKGTTDVALDGANAILQWVSPGLVAGVVQTIVRTLAVNQGLSVDEMEDLASVWARTAPDAHRPGARSENVQPAEAVGEIVECSVFGPATGRPGKTILIQVFLHRANQAKRASFLATTMDAFAKMKGAKPLDLPVKRGARVEIAFSANGLMVDEPVQSVVWQGEPTFCQFLTTIPVGTSGQSFFPVVRVSVDGKLVGRIAFSLSSDDAASQPVSLPLGDHAKLYKYAFVSYASKDRNEVLKRVQMLEVLKTQFFQDILSLDPGDRWEKKLYENIDRCDLFLLFWSQAAKDSEWVLKEAEYALAHQQKNPGSEPDLVPVVLEQHVSPPPSLSGFHFNDRISYLVSLMS